jgi:mono/diheme cytochrome c family protein
MKKHIKHYGKAFIILMVLLVAGTGIFIYSGIYSIGADDPHIRPVYYLLQTLRDRSIDARASDVKVPNLEDKALILKGAGQYAAMCTQCHLAPGMNNSEIRPGLYPEPPQLAKMNIAPQRAFWVIKHGIKMSSMPAWGFNHDDDTIWSLVAFLQKLPEMNAEQYKAMVAIAPPDEEMAGGHEHGHGDGHADTHMDTHADTHTH